MIRLIRVELSRLLRRRAVLVLLAASLVIPVLIGVGVVLDTRPPSAAAIAEAEAQLERDLASDDYSRELQNCLEKPQDWGLEGLDEAELAEQCETNTQPQLDWYLWFNELDLASERDTGTGIAVTLVLAITMMLLGTTFTGHDWASGSVSNQLLFEPRRLRIWLAKALVVTGMGLLVAAAVLTSYWLVLNAVAGSRDLPSGGAVLLDCLQMGWRASGVVALAALCGFALTMLFRSTVATLGVLFGIALAGGVLLGALGFEVRWNPALNVDAVITDGVTYLAEIPCPPEAVEEMGGWCTEEREITFAQGAGYLGAAVGATCLISTLSFRRRDVP